MPINYDRIGNRQDARSAKNRRKFKNAELKIVNKIGKMPKEDPDGIVKSGVILGSDVVAPPCFQFPPSLPNIGILPSVNFRKSQKLIAQYKYFMQERIKKESKARNKNTPKKGKRQPFHFIGRVEWRGRNGSSEIHKPELNELSAAIGILNKSIAQVTDYSKFPKIDYTVDLIVVAPRPIAGSLSVDLHVHMVGFVGKNSVDDLMKLYQMHFSTPDLHSSNERDPVSTFAYAVNDPCKADILANMEKEYVIAFHEALKRKQLIRPTGEFLIWRAENKAFNFKENDDGTVSKLERRPRKRTEQKDDIKDQESRLVTLTNMYIKGINEGVAIVFHKKDVDPSKIIQSNYSARRAHNDIRAIKQRIAEQEAQLAALAAVSEDDFASAPELPANDGIGNDPHDHTLKWSAEKPAAVPKPTWNVALTPETTMACGCRFPGRKIWWPRAWPHRQRWPGRRGPIRTWDRQSRMTATHISPVNRHRTA